MFVKYGDPLFDQHLSILGDEDMTALIEDAYGDRFTVVARPGVVVVVKDGGPYGGAVYQGNKLFFNENAVLLYEYDAREGGHVRFSFDVVAIQILTN